MRPALALLVVLAACAGAESPLAGPAAVEFEASALGETRSLDIELSNRSFGDLALVDARITSGDAAVFAVEPAPVVLAPGARTLLRVRATPLAQQRYSAILRVSAWDGREGHALDVRLSVVGRGDRLDRDGDGWTTVDGDCDDADPTVHPDALDADCDGGDRDCDGEVGPDEHDADLDGVLECDGCLALAPDAAAAAPAWCGDCDDDDPSVRPGAPELCDPVDRDCDGLAGGADTDGDGARGCDGDCDDRDPLSAPHLPEQCGDLRDDDCSGALDDRDEDGDGFSLCGDRPDCNDTNAAAHPVILEASGVPGGDGTPSAPFTDIDAALGALDGFCDTVYAGPGEYTATVAGLRGVRVLEGSDRDSVHLRFSGSWDDNRDIVLRSITLHDPLRLLSGTLELHDVRVTGLSWPILLGVAQKGGPDVRITDSLFEGNPNGALVLFEGSLRSTFTTWRDNGNPETIVGREPLPVADPDDWQSLERRAVLVGHERDSAAEARFDANVFMNNAGGAIATRAARIVSVDSVFQGNRAEFGPAVLSFGEGSGSVDLRRAVFLDNEASEVGGAVYGAAIDVVASRFLHNRARWGGGAWFTDGGGSLIANSTLVGNEATEGASAVGGGSQVALIVADSVGASSLCAAPTDHGTSPVRTHNSLFASPEGCPGPVWGSDANDVLLEDPFDGYDPAAPPTAWDLGVSPGSPAWDSGPIDDVWRDTDGSRNDRGYTGGPHAAERP